MIKTVYIPFVPPYYSKLTSNVNLKVGNYVIVPSTNTINLGVKLDSHLDMNNRTSQIISTCSYQLRNIKCIRNILTIPVTERIINALFTSSWIIAIHYSQVLLREIMIAYKNCNIQQRDVF